MNTVKISLDNIIKETKAQIKNALNVKGYVDCKQLGKLECLLEDLKAARAYFIK